MKQIILLSILVCLTISGYGQLKIKKVEIKETGFNVALKYAPVTNEIVHDGLKVKVTPISPDDLNSEFLIEKTLNGRLNYSYYDNSRESYFLKKNAKYTEKSNLEFLRDGTQWLLENQKISQTEYDELEKQIFYFYLEDAQSDLDLDAVTSANPYRLGEKFLSVFKIEIFNSTNTYKTFSGDIIVESGSQIQKSLSENEIIQFLANDKTLNNNKIESLKRHNLSLPISVPPNAKFEKYFAVFPIDYRNNILSASLSGNDTKLKWDITKTEGSIDEKYTYYEINIVYVYDNIPTTEGTFFTVLNYPEPLIYFNNNLMYIDEKQISTKFELFCLSLKGDRLFYARIPFSGSELINFDKNRRNTLSISLTKIEDIKKRVKQ